MARYFLFLSYNGERFNGWQTQKNAISLQSSLEQCLSIILREDIKLTGAGRTDTGVHASYYVAHFDSEKLILLGYRDFLHKANNFLTKDIHLFDIKQVKDNAHARFDALSRTYEYHITGIKNPFKNNFQFQIPYSVFSSLSIANMNAACAELFNYTDFSCFSKSGTQTKTNDCKIMEALCTINGNEIIIRIKADRFLRNMVRAISGTLLDIGAGKLSISDFCNIIESQNRSNAGISVPAKGLFLVDIQYPEVIF
jgi:tRNA pseudouridine38-40 synthase